MNYLVQGLLLGIAYVAPIGMQNMYLINTAIESNLQRTLQIALIIIFFDVTLALSCFFGIGVLLEYFSILKFLVMGMGSLAIIYIGYNLIKTTPNMNFKTNFEKPLYKAAISCFAVTWLNPQAIIDGTLLLGGFKATLSPNEGILFITGVSAASILWFTSISFIVSSLKNIFDEKILKIINVICGSILIIFGIKLGISFIQSF